MDKKERITGEGAREREKEKGHGKKRAKQKQQELLINGQLNDENMRE